MENSSYTIEATRENFEQDVVQASFKQPVMVDFWATWCNPCKLLLPILNQLAGEYQGKFILAKVDTAQEKELSRQFAIRSIPAVMLFKDGEVVDSFNGALHEPQIRAFLDNHLPCESDSLLAEAKELYNSDAEAALEKVNQAIEKAGERDRIISQGCELMIDNGQFESASPHLHNLTIDQETDALFAPLLARLHFAEITQQAPDNDTLQQRITQDENDLEAHYLLAAQLAKTACYEEAMEQLISIMKKDAKYENGAARKAMLKIFEALGNGGELVHKYRMQMAKCVM